MNKEKEEARLLCAYSNKYKDCKDCVKVNFIPISCREWMYYLIDKPKENFISKLIGKLREIKDYLSEVFWSN